MEQLQARFLGQDEESRINSAAASTWPSAAAIPSAEALCQRSKELVQARLSHSTKLLPWNVMVSIKPSQLALMRYAGLLRCTRQRLHGPERYVPWPVLRRVSLHSLSVVTTCVSTVCRGAKLGGTSKLPMRQRSSHHERPHVSSCFSAQAPPNS